MNKDLVPKFIPGLKLSRLFYRRIVQPILDREFPGLHYSAALIGWGSEVLGFDTTMSRDHHWGPRVLLFLSKQDYPGLHQQIDRVLANNLPYEFLGYSTNFSKPEPNGVRHPEQLTTGPVNHMIQIYTPSGFLRTRLGFDDSRTISVFDWLTFPQQRLLELTTGEVFHDGIGELEKIRRQFSYYPRDIWLYVLAAQWTRISQEEAFVGRTGDVDDELGSQIVAARIVRELMKLSFLLERQYAPYTKWFGSAFSKLRIAKSLKPLLIEVLSAKDWKLRENSLSKAYSIVVKKQNSLKITKALSVDTTNYFGRPYLVIHADEIAIAIRQAIRNPEVRKIRTWVGAIDQFTDSTDVISDTQLGRKLQAVYQ
ncbi:MAG TPA: DUF4037 domain-containing protein [Pyrinomonadaceae bacterium]